MCDDKEAFLFFKQKTAYEVATCLEFRRVLFRSDRITERTKAIVVINPNNPTGAVYPEHVLQDIVEVAREHGLMILADEIYDKILYDDVVHTPIASFAPDLLSITFNGLSKA